MRTESRESRAESRRVIAVTTFLLRAGGRQPVGAGGRLAEEHLVLPQASSSRSSHRLSALQGLAALPLLAASFAGGRRAKAHDVARSTSESKVPTVPRESASTPTSRNTSLNARMFASRATCRASVPVPLAARNVGSVTVAVELGGSAADAGRDERIGQYDRLHQLVRNGISRERPGTC